MPTRRKQNANPVIAFVLTVLLFIAQFLSSKAGWFTANFFDCSKIDPDGLFASVAIHHIVQMTCALLIILFLNKARGIKGFKLRPRFDKKGIRYTLIFCGALTLYYLAVYIIGNFTHTIGTYDYELNKTNVMGTLGFQLLLSGPSEEILFRSLPITSFMYYLKPDCKKTRAAAVILTALLFGLAHININTFEIPWFQVCYAFVLGLAYGYTLLRTKSVIYPMLMHSMSNVISVGGCYIYMMLVK